MLLLPATRSHTIQGFKKRVVEIELGELRDAKLVEGLLKGVDYALRDSIPSRPSPLGAEGCEHSQGRLRSYAASDCKLAVAA